MPLHACLTCGALTPTKRCPAHAHLSTGARGSTRAWRTLRQQVLERDAHTCQVQLRCNGHPADCVDHIHPKSQGGTDHPANLRAACTPCNLARGAD